MTSLKQIEANRRNAQKSTGPTTLEGKQRSRCNALRHGLTAETVIGVLENAEDYAAFEAVIMAEYGAQSVIECELVARLASLLWRLRRATAIETGLFGMQADPLTGFRQSLRATVASGGVVGLSGKTGFPNPMVGGADMSGAMSSSDHVNTGTAQFAKVSSPNLTQCFLCLANQSSFALDRLSRYEASLWRQADQIIIVLGNLQGARK